MTQSFPQLTKHFRTVPTDSEYTEAVWRAYQAETALDTNDPSTLDEWLEAHRERSRMLVERQIAKAQGSKS